MLSEISQTEKDKYCMISRIYEIYKNQKKEKPNSWKKRLWLPEVKGRGEEELEEGGQRVQTSSYKINKYQECNAQHDGYS